MRVRTRLALLTILVLASAGVIAALLLFPRRPPSVPLTLRARWTERHVEKPNVVLITLDTTRADHLGCYGNANARGRPDDDATFGLASTGRSPARSRDRGQVRDGLQHGPHRRLDRDVVGKGEDAEHGVRPATGHDQWQVAAQRGTAGHGRHDVEGRRRLVHRPPDGVTWASDGCGQSGGGAFIEPEARRDLEHAFRPATTIAADPTS